MARVLITGPTVEPVTVDEAKAHVRVDGSDEDGFLEALIATARGLVEDFTSRALLSQVWELRLDAWAPTILLPNPPLLSVDAVTCIDQDGATQTLPPGDYQVDTASKPGRLAPAYGKSWPSVRPDLGAIAIRYTAGYGTTADKVPAPIRHAVLLTVGHLYQNRESAAELPSVAAALLWNYRTARV